MLNMLGSSSEAEMSSVALYRRPQKAPPDLPAAPLSLPTLFGEGYGQYQSRVAKIASSSGNPEPPPHWLNRASLAATHR